MPGFVVGERGLGHDPAGPFGDLGLRPMSVPARLPQEHCDRPGNGALILAIHGTTIPVPRRYRMMHIVLQNPENTLGTQ